MASIRTLKIYVVTNRNPHLVTCSSNCTAEELCILLCKKHNIAPITRTLFALRIKGTDYFLKDNIIVPNDKDYDLRIRYKVPRIDTLLKLDENTFDYYYQQCRNDINNNKVPEIKYPEHKDELLGLGICDMTRAVIEKNVSPSQILENYKEYIPNIILKKHWRAPKKWAREHLPPLSAVGYTASYVKNLYLKELYGLAPNYLAEEFDKVLWQNGSELVNVKLVVSPFHQHHPGIRLYDKSKREWSHICKIEELIYMTRNGDNSLEISRRGTPFFFNFRSEEQLSSFISVCDGYYRLMVKWTFNLSKDDETPSLKELQRMKCHGPVGGAFSYRKLEEKRGKKHGCYILRQCQYEYNIFYLDICTKNGTIEPYRMEFKGHCYVFNKEEYYSIERLVNCHQNPEARIFLKECIPPSEYDKSQLLLCGEPQKGGVRVDQTELQEILKDNKSPRCLLNKDILLYTDEYQEQYNVVQRGKFDVKCIYKQGSEKFDSDGVTATYKALWRLDATRKLLVAFKCLLPEKTSDYLKDFIELASKWSCIQSSSVVRLYGVTLSSPTALVMEYLPYGPLDVYLRDHSDRVEMLQLKKVAASLARALWDLSEAGVVHGYIRCSRLLLVTNDPNRIMVKLCGPTLHAYTAQDVHWIPVDFISDLSMAQRSVLGDIWAFATTMWEIFSYGQKPTETNPVLTARSYEMGERLMKPAQCPNKVWTLIRQCWQSDPLRPQEIMRDMNHMLYSEYIPVHKYEEPKILLNHTDHGDTFSSNRCLTSELSDGGSSKSMMISVDGSLMSMNGTMLDHYDQYFVDNKSTSSSWRSMNGLPQGLRGSLPSQSPIGGRPGFPPVGSTGVDMDGEYGAGAPLLMESIVSQGKTYLITLTKKIGSGNYGHVYKGWMERDNQEAQEGKEVAVKKLSRQESEGNGTLYEDFKNELEIMKSLQHVNIVEILGYSWDHSSDVLIVMEYFEEGSLHYFLKFQGDNLRISHLLKYCLDIATAMDHVSAKNVVHRDLATRNILVVNKYHVKVSDFGLARMLPKEENEYKIKTERLLPINWYAPESAVEPWHFSTKSDVWSYGVTAWEIFTHAKQDVPKFDVERPSERSSCFPIPDACPSEIFRGLMKDCWELDPNKRPKFIDLVHMCKRLLEEYK